MNNIKIIVFVVGVLLNGIFTITYAKNTELNSAVTTENKKLQPQEIFVGMEPFPPFINKKGMGYTIDMFKEIEKISNLKFNVSIMTYARAKKELKLNRIDIAGHTPKDLETSSFYQYAQELEWQLITHSDYFFLDKKYFELSSLKSNHIGTTIGNAKFFAEQTGIELDMFVEVSSLEQLVKMLLAGRIQVIIFERVSVMTTLMKLNKDKVFYRTAGMIPASIAVQNNEKGRLLKEKLDQLILTLDQDRIFGNYLEYMTMPDEGIVPQVMLH